MDYTEMIRISKKGGLYASRLENCLAAQIVGTAETYQGWEDRLGNAVRLKK